MSEKKGRVRALKYLNNRWVLIKDTNRDDIVSQAIITSDICPVDRIKKMWDLHKRVVQISFGNGVYIIVCQEEREDFNYKQEIHFSNEFPTSFIDKEWEKNRSVACIEYCEDHWVVVTEESRGNIIQNVITTSNELPTKEVKEAWDSDKRVLSITSHGNKWIMIVESSKEGGQSYAGNSEWPDEKINEKYNQSFYITSVAYNTSSNAWVLIFDKRKKEETSGQMVTLTKEFPEEEIRKMEVTRYGKRFL